MVRMKNWAWRRSKLKGIQAVECNITKEDCNSPPLGNLSQPLNPCPGAASRFLLFSRRYRILAIRDPVAPAGITVRNCFQSARLQSLEREFIYKTIGSVHKMRRMS
ncbi:hypothetical protein D3C87_906320 [compost metagenome]